MSMTFDLGNGSSGDGGGPGGAPGDLIKDSNLQNFEADVINASMTTPVLVDFWAPWCGPCKQLTPALEKAVKGANGKVKLVKINIDENPELQQHLRIQSVPTIYAFKGGQPVDGFAGALPDSQIKTFIERIAGPVGPSPLEQILDQADQLLASGDLSSAAQAYGAALQEAQDEPRAIGGLARCYVLNKDFERARQTLNLAPPAKQSDPAIASVMAELELAEGAGDTGEVAALKAKVEANPKDHQARFDLAGALAAEGNRGDAIDELLEIVRQDRTWNEEAARKQLLTLFDALGPTDDLTVNGRRRLSAILFA